MMAAPNPTPSCAPDLDASRLLAPADEQASDIALAAYARALGHPVRVRILRMLARKQPRMCCHIVDELPLAQSTVSEHLRLLKSAGLVRANENGPRVSYCVVPEALVQMKTLLGDL
jgi:ArsR family transcriptional regulator, arsenate/arsenite/antimonite-responsive transcriptional repressor